MTKLPRITQRIFGDTAIQDNAIAQFGSVVAQNPLFTGDIKQIQALDYWSKGWVGATVTARRYPTAEETTGINKVVTQQLAYIFQEGIPEYDTGTTYPKGGWCKGLNAGVTTIYESLEDDNINNPLTDATKWKVVEFSGSSGSLEVCDIGMALYVDETKGLRRYLNGQIVDINENTQAFLNRLKKITTLYPSLLCTEDEWQMAKTMSVFGQVGKFVFNYSGETVVSVRIPRVVNIQGVFDLQNLGLTVAAGLPTHTHTRGTMEISGSLWGGNRNGSSSVTGAFAQIDAQAPWGAGGSGLITNFLADFYASRSWTGSTSAPDNSVYGASNTVQQEAIQYPYFIQIATGAETENNIINEIELNNPYGLFDFKWADHELNNISWTRADNFDWKSSATYPSAYNELLAEYNNAESVEETESGITFKRTPKGYKIALANQETAIQSRYETYGIAWYYILDITNTQFKLPRTKFGFEGLRDKVSNNITESVPNIMGGGVFVYGPQKSGATKNIDTRVYGLGSGTSWIEGVGTGVFRASDSNSAYKDGAPVQERATQMYLYFYVGETVQNANLIDAGRIGEQLANKQDKCIHITETYKNGTSWYRVYSDGWCEQGGNASQSVTFLKPYINTNYIITLGKMQDSNTTDNAVLQVHTKSSTGFTLYRGWGNGSGSPVNSDMWQTCGYIR